MIKYQPLLISYYLLYLWGRLYPSLFTK